MIDTAKTASKIIQSCMWRNGYLKPFVKAWIDDGIADWSLTDIKEKDREKFIVSEVKSLVSITKEVVSD